MLIKSHCVEKFVREKSRHSKTNGVWHRKIHCRVLPPGEFESMIPHSLPVYSFSFITTAVTVLPHDAMHSADYAVAKYPSVCLSVRLSHAGILSKRLKKSSNFFHRQIATPFEFRQGSPKVRRRMQGVWKQRDFRPISCFMSEMIPIKIEL